MDHFCAPRLLWFYTIFSLLFTAAIKNEKVITIVICVGFPWVGNVFCCKLDSSQRSSPRTKRECGAVSRRWFGFQKFDLIFSAFDVIPKRDENIRPTGSDCHPQPPSQQVKVRAWCYFTGFWNYNTITAAVFFFIRLVASGLFSVPLLPALDLFTFSNMSGISLVNQYSNFSCRMNFWSKFQSIWRKFRCISNQLYVQLYVVTC